MAQLIEFVNDTDTDLISTSRVFHGQANRTDHYRAMGCRSLELHLEEVQEDLEVEELRASLNRNGKFNVGFMY